MQAYGPNFGRSESVAKYRRYRVRDPALSRIWKSKTKHFWKQSLTQEQVLGSHPYMELKWSFLGFCFENGFWIFRASQRCAKPWLMDSFGSLAYG